MGKKKGGSKSFSSSTSEQSSEPLSAAELSTYFGNLNKISGGRLNRFAKDGTLPVAYKAPTASQVKALGGLGATQKLDIRRAQQQQLDQITSDPSLSAFQKVRGEQLTNQDALQQTQALDKETEAAITALLQDSAKTSTETGFRNSEQRRQDAQALAEIFFGGKGQKSKGKSTTTSTGSSIQKSTPLEDLGNVVSFGFKL